MYDDDEDERRIARAYSDAWHLLDADVPSDAQLALDGAVTAGRY